LIETYDSNLILAQKCDVTNYSDLNNLWESTFEKFKRVDIWINNAGVGQNNRNLWELTENEVQNIVSINITGMMLGTKLALEKMENQGFGAIYNMEGFGSDGRMRNKMSIYGSSKRALNYFTEGLISETKNSKIIIGLISPGMVTTELLLSATFNDSNERKSFEKIVNIIGDKVETVSHFLVKEMIKNTKHGKAIRWLTNTKLIIRFLTYPFSKRNIIDK